MKFNGQLFPTAMFGTVLLLSASAQAADVAAEAAAVQSAIGYRIGAAFAGVHNTEDGNGLEPSGGTNASDTRYSGIIDAAVGYDFAPNWGVQGDVYAAFFQNPDKGDLDDWTRAYGHGAAHLYYRAGDFLVGGFGGYGAHNDTGDSDESMSYWFLGAEGKVQTNWGSLFAQAGYLDSKDEYDEGTSNAPFVRLGANYFVNDNWSVKADAAYAGGIKYDDNDFKSRILDFNLESEYRPDSWPVSLFGRYEYTQISYQQTGNPNRYGDNFHTFMVGLKFRSGATLREADRAPGSLDLPSVGKWVAFNANEIE